MIKVSKPTSLPPENMKTELQSLIYDTFEKLDIAFVRVDNDEAITMEDCIEINKNLNADVVKTLFLCNRQKTKFYLFVTTAEKPFVTKNFSTALGISRVSFASADKLLDTLKTKVGATTVLSTVLDINNDVSLIIDSDTLKSEWFACTDGTTTSYLKIKTSDLLDKYLKFTKHNPVIIDL